MLELAGFSHCVPCLLIEETGSASACLTPSLLRRDGFLHPGAGFSEEWSHRVSLLWCSCREVIAQEYISKAAVYSTVERSVSVVVSLVQLKGLLCMASSLSAQPPLCGLVISTLQKRLWSSRKVLCFSHWEDSLAKKLKYRVHAGPADVAKQQELLRKRSKWLLCTGHLQLLLGTALVWPCCRRGKASTSS